MAAIIFRTCLIVGVFALTRAFPDPGSIGGGSIADPGNFQLSNTMGGALLGFDTPDKSIDTLLSSTVDVSTKLKWLNESVEKLKDKVVDAGKCECSATATTKANADDIGSLRTSVEALQTTCSQQKTTVDGMATSVQTLSGQVADQDFSGAMNALSGGLDVISTTITGLNQDLGSSTPSGQEDLQQIQTGVSTLTSSVSQLGPEVTTCTSQCADAATTGDGLMTVGQHTNLETSITDLKGRLSSAEDSATSMENILTNLAFEIGTLQTTVNAAEQGTKGSQSSANAVDATVTGVDNGIKALKEETLQHTGNAELLQQSAEGAIEQINTFHSSLSAGANSFVDDITALRNTLAGITADLEASEISAGDTSSEVNTLKTDMTQIQNAISEVTASVGTSSSDIQTSQTTLSGIQSDMGNLDVSGDIDSIRDSLDDLESKIATAENKLKPKCPSPFYLDTTNNICYYANEVDLTWWEASIRCRDLGGETARLAVIDSDRKRQFYENLLWYEYEYEYFVGLFVVDKYGWSKYMWMGGTFDDDTDTTWNPWEPSYYDSCGSLYDSDYYGHKLHESYCDSAKRSVCEIPQE